MLLTDLGYNVTESRCPTLCLRATLAGFRVHVVVHHRAAAPSWLVRSFDLFAAEAYWLPRTGQGFATANALNDWSHRTLTGGRNELRLARLYRYIEKGFKTALRADSCESPVIGHVVSQVPDGPGYTALTLSAQRVQAQEPLELGAQLRTRQLQTPWVYCLGFDGVPKELCLDVRVASHRAFLEKVDEVRRLAGADTQVASPFVRLRVTDTVEHSKLCLCLGRFRGCLGAFVAGPEMLRDFAATLKLDQSRISASVTSAPFTDVAFPVAEDCFETSWEHPLFAVFGEHQRLLELSHD